MLTTQSGAGTPEFVAWAGSCERIRHWDRDGRTRLRGTGQGGFRYFWVKGYSCPIYLSYRHHTAHAFQTHHYPFGLMPPVDIPLTLGPKGVLCVLALVCLLRNINAEFKKKQGLVIKTQTIQL